MKTFSARNPRVMAVLVIAVAFLSGAVCVWLYLSPRSARMLPSTINMEVHRGLPDDLRQLDLSPAQRTSILTVLDSARDKSVDLMRSFEPRLSVLLDSADQKIQSLLTVEQRARLAALRASGPRRLVKHETVIDGRRTTTSDTLRR